MLAAAPSAWPARRFWAGVCVCVCACAPSAWAALYVINPLSPTTCHAGAPCAVEWIDDGARPLLPDVGVALVGLFHGNNQLVQQITPVDVSAVHSLRFTPNPNIGANSNLYYVAFQSTTFQQNGAAYAAYSPFFTIDGLTGDPARPDPALTAPIPVPPALMRRPTGDVASTSTVGTLSTTTSTSTATAAAADAAVASDSSTPASTTTTPASETSTPPAGPLRMPPPPSPLPPSPSPSTSTSTSTSAAASGTDRTCGARGLLLGALLPPLVLVVLLVRPTACCYY